MNKIIILFLVVFVFFISGCATVPTREAFATYNLRGTTYYPLIKLCEARGIHWDYDTFARVMSLSRDSHRINLKAGDDLVLVDGNVVNLNHPVDIYQGSLVVPYKFKTQVLDRLFKEYYPAKKAVTPPIKIRKIVIDAGHGGYDPGAIGRTGLREKDVNLDIAKRVANLLSSQGVEVVMTRPTDKFISLSKRTEIANNSRADLFVSIHANANHARSLNGFEIYYVAASISDSNRALNSARNARLNFDSGCFASNSQDLRAILWDMVYTYSRAESIELAHSICRSADDNLGIRIIGVKGAKFQVLTCAQMPAVLVEVGFLSNRDEEERLKDKYYRQKIAEGIVGGIRDYARDLTLLEAASQ
jgi:N-acetylmuramoyl-L-alanine amidase